MRLRRQRGHALKGLRRPGRPLAGVLDEEIGKEMLLEYQRGCECYGCAVAHSTPLPLTTFIVGMQSRAILRPTEFSNPCHM